MKKLAIEHSGELSEYKKIRTYVVSRIYKAGKTPFRLASTRELAEIFKVSQPTVVKALKDLINDGLLSSVRGVGLFTNPSAIRLHNNMKLVGIFTSSGKQAYMDRMHARISYAFSESLMRSSKQISVCNSFLSSSLNNEDDVINEIDSQGLDAIVWLSPDKRAVRILEKLKKANKTAITVFNSPASEKLSSLNFDFKQDNKTAALAMIKDGCRKLMLVCTTEESMSVQAEGIKEAFTESAIPEKDFCLFAHKEGKLDKFIETACKFSPDAIIFNIDIDHYWEKILAHPEIFAKCCFSSGCWSIYDDMNYNGLKSVPELDKALEKIIFNLLSQIKNPEQTSILHEYINMKIS